MKNVYGLFKDNLKEVEISSIMLYQSKTKYTNRRIWNLCFYSNVLRKSFIHLQSDKIINFMEHIEEAFDDRKSNWLDMRLNIIDSNEAQLKLF